MEVYMSLTMILLVLCLLLLITGVISFIKGMKSKSIKYTGLGIVLLLMPVGIYYTLLYFISCM